jgi:peptide-N4-(N-acetyl-beta-glucosaminyl)asparagine amidase
VRGDSGSWVVDAKSGDLYGHIVAGIPGQRLAYVMPAINVATDMEEKLGSQVSFASTLSSDGKNTIVEDIS